MATVSTATSHEPSFAELLEQSIGPDLCADVFVPRRGHGHRALQRLVRRGLQHGVQASFQHLIAGRARRHERRAFVGGEGERLIEQRLQLARIR